MPMLSPLREGVPLLKGLKLLNRGKVRDTYELENKMLLIVCTDGISIFDFVLNALVPNKGWVLTAMSHFWLSMLEKEYGIKTHMVAAGAAIDQYLPEHLRGNVDTQCRSMVVNPLEMDKGEFIGRAFLTGSVVDTYHRTGMVNGVKLPSGLEDGDRLPYILDTPTTKADVGHDEPLDAAGIRTRYPEQTRLTVEVVQIIFNHAGPLGILLADTKLEFGRDKEGSVVLGDEVGTPDSSRFWGIEEWQKSRHTLPRKAPPPFDKQLPRIWGIEQGLNKSTMYDPKNEADVRKVHKLLVPSDLIGATTQTYRYIFWRLTGKTLEQYFREELGVALPSRKKKLALLFGSASDIASLGGTLDHVNLGNAAGEPAVHVVSCHRNPDELRTFVDSGCGGVDAIVASGGMAFALPGVLESLIHQSGRHVPVVGVALGKKDSEDLLAAQLSISQLPSQPVVMDEVYGVYTGAEGFKAAIRRVLDGELPPPKIRTAKPAQFNLKAEVLYGT
jgi:phosphoribosylaminoimidazole-succinocarboxamide synthase